MVRVGFRARLFLILALFAVVPALIVSAGAYIASREVVPLLGGGTAWDSVAATGRSAMTAVRAAPLTETQRAAVDAHERLLQESMTSAQRVRFLSSSLPLVFAIGVAIVLLLLAYPVIRVAGHLTRQLSRPLDELVGWTERIARGEPLPESAETRGAPEFEVLRSGMRSMAGDLEVGRVRALEAERLRAFRESARRFAHELKNPLTPIRFSLSRLRREAPAPLHDAIDVIVIEAERLEAMARSFAQFGRLPEGPAAEVDVAELIHHTIRATVPEGIELTMEIANDLPHILGHHDTLVRALSNVLLNAVDAAGPAGHITVTARATDANGQPAVRIGVHDTGPGIAPERLTLIWEPYVTDKAGGTGLGLAIARAAIEAHGGDVFAASCPGDTEIGFLVPVNAQSPTPTGD